MTTDLWRSFPSCVRLPAGSDLNPEPDRGTGARELGCPHTGLVIHLDRHMNRICLAYAFSQVLLVVEDLHVHDSNRLSTQ